MRSLTTLCKETTMLKKALIALAGATVVGFVAKLVIRHKLENA